MISTCAFGSISTIMSTKRTAAKAPNKAAAKPKKAKSIKDALLSTDEQVLKSLKLQFVGKWLFIKAAAIYGKSVPAAGKRTTTSSIHRERYQESRWDLCFDRI